MIEKIKMPKDVTEAIDHLRKDGMTNFNIMYQVHGAAVTKLYLTIRRWAFDGGGGSPDNLMRALVNGYEIEKTPEEKVHEVYWSYIEGGHQSEAAAIRVAFTLYNIKIEGVNA